MELGGSKPTVMPIIGLGQGQELARLHCMAMHLNDIKENGRSGRISKADRTGKSTSPACIVTWQVKPFI